jgi:hypothetical protein
VLRDPNQHLKTREIPRIPRVHGSLRRYHRSYEIKNLVAGKTLAAKFEAELEQLAKAVDSPLTSREVK